MLLTGMSINSSVFIHQHQGEHITYMATAAAYLTNVSWEERVFHASFMACPYKLHPKLTQFIRVHVPLPVLQYVVIQMKSQVRMP